MFMRGLLYKPSLPTNRASGVGEQDDAEKKAVLSSAGMITANKYRAKWGFSPEQRLEGEYGAVNFYPAAEGGMIIDSLRDAIRKVRGKGLQPALCFVRLAVSDL